MTPSLQHKKIGKRLHNAKVTFKHGDENWAGKYTVGYTLENSLGQLTLDLESLIPFTLSQIRPVITQFVETQSCIEGEDMTFTFKAQEMSDAEWVFEKADDDGITVAYTPDRMRELFPDSSFDASVADGTATLTVSNAKAELCEYILYAYAVGISTNSSAGIAQMNVISVPELSAAGWQKIGNNWYYFAASGAMYTGWLQSGGAMAANQPLTIGGKKYTFDASGHRIE